MLSQGDTSHTVRPFTRYAHDITSSNILLLPPFIIDLLRDNNHVPKANPSLEMPRAKL